MALGRGVHDQALLEKAASLNVQGFFVFESQEPWIEIEIEIAIEIGTLPEIDFDRDHDFDDCWAPWGEH